MKQMKLPAEMIIPYDYEAPDVPESVKTLRPVIFKDRERDLGTSCDGFCILLGEDPQVGIMGCGMCLEEAIDDWRKSLRERILNAKDDDELANFVKDSLQIQKIDTW